MYISLEGKAGRLVREREGRENTDLLKKKAGILPGEKEKSTSCFSHAGTIAEGRERRSEGFWKREDRNQGVILFTAAARGRKKEPSPLSSEGGSCPASFSRRKEELWL